MFGIPVPEYALVHREFPCQELDYFIEEDDFVEIRGRRFWKPFVEKPIDGELLSWIEESKSFSLRLVHICAYKYTLLFFLFLRSFCLIK